MDSSFSQPSKEDSSIVLFFAHNKVCFSLRLLQQTQPYGNRTHLNFITKGNKQQSICSIPLLNKNRQPSNSSSYSNSCSDPPKTFSRKFLSDQMTSTQDNKNKLISYIIKKEKYKQTKPYIQEIAQQKQSSIKISIQAIEEILSEEFNCQAKLYALRYLKDCFEMGSIKFIKEVEKKILPILTNIVIDSTDEKSITKYAGSSYTKTTDLEKFKSILVSFFMMAKQCIYKWSEWIPSSDEYKFISAFQTVRKKGVRFDPNDFKYFRDENQINFMRNLKENSGIKFIIKRHQEESNARRNDNSQQEKQKNDHSSSLSKKQKGESLSKAPKASPLEKQTFVLGPRTQTKNTNKYILKCYEHFKKCDQKLQSNTFNDKDLQEMNQKVNQYLSEYMGAADLDENTMEEEIEKIFLNIKNITEDYQQMKKVIANNKAVEAQEKQKQKPIKDASMGVLNKQKQESREQKSGTVNNRKESVHSQSSSSKPSVPKVQKPSLSSQKGTSDKKVLIRKVQNNNQNPSKPTQHSKLGQEFSSSSVTNPQNQSSNLDFAEQLKRQQLKAHLQAQQKIKPEEVLVKKDEPTSSTTKITRKQRIQQLKVKNEERQQQRGQKETEQTIKLSYNRQPIDEQSHKASHQRETNEIPIDSKLNHRSPKNSNVNNNSSVVTFSQQQQKRLRVGGQSSSQYESSSINQRQQSSQSKSHSHSHHPNQHQHKISATTSKRQIFDSSLSNLNDEHTNSRVNFTQSIDGSDSENEESSINLLSSNIKNRKAAEDSNLSDGSSSLMLSKSNNHQKNHSPNKSYNSSHQQQQPQPQQKSPSQSPFLQNQLKLSSIKQQDPDQYGYNETSSRREQPPNQQPSKLQSVQNSIIEEYQRKIQQLQQSMDKKTTSERDLLNRMQKIQREKQYQERQIEKIREENKNIMKKTLIDNNSRVNTVHEEQYHRIKREYIKMKRNNDKMQEQMHKMYKEMEKLKKDNSQIEVSSGFNHNNNTRHQKDNRNEESKNSIANLSNNSNILKDLYPNSTQKHITDGNRNNRSPRNDERGMQLHSEENEEQKVNNRILPLSINDDSLALKEHPRHPHNSESRKRPHQQYEKLDSDYNQNKTSVMNISEWMDENNITLFKEFILKGNDLFYSSGMISIIGCIEQNPHNKDNNRSTQDQAFKLIQNIPMTLKLSLTFQINSLKKNNKPPFVKYFNIEEADIWANELKGEKNIGSASSVPLFHQELIVSLRKFPFKMIKMLIRVSEHQEVQTLLPFMYFSFLKNGSVNLTVEEYEEVADKYIGTNLTKSKIFALNRKRFPNGKIDEIAKMCLSRKLILLNKSRLLFHLYEKVPSEAFWGEICHLPSSKNKYFIKVVTVPFNQETSQKAKQLIDDIVFLLS